jgi:uncharacterized protein YndB with AHSA1/START domain
MMPDSHSVVERRHYEASREVVFKALSEATYISRWLSPSDDILTDVSLFEFRRGGRFRFGFRSNKQDYGHVSGEYVEIVPPEKLSFTWVWEEPDVHAGIQTLVTIELTTSGEATDLVLTHSQFPSEEMCSRHFEGWKGEPPIKPCHTINPLLDAFVTC